MCCRADKGAVGKAQGRRRNRIDEKTFRRSLREASKKNPLHVASAWSSENGIVLGEFRTDKTSNGIAAIPKLPVLLDIEGSTAAIDAIASRAAIARKVLDSGGITFWR